MKSLAIKNEMLTEEWAPDQPKVCGALLVARDESSLQPGPGLSVYGKCAQA